MSSNRMIIIDDEENGEYAIRCDDIEKIYPRYFKDEDGPRGCSIYLFSEKAFGMIPRQPTEVTNSLRELVAKINGDSHA